MPVFGRGLLIEIPERRESLNKIREELTAKYCSENSKDVHLTGQQVFYELSFFTEYETKIWYTPVLREYLSPTVSGRENANVMAGICMV